MIELLAQIALGAETDIPPPEERLQLVVELTQAARIRGIISRVEKEWVGDRAVAIRIFGTPHTAEFQADAAMVATVVDEAYMSIELRR